MISKLRCSVSLAALALASGMALTSAASAADVPMKAGRQMAPMMPVAYSWHGFYFGGHIGAGDAEHDGLYNADDGTSAVHGDEFNLNGVLAGLHGGYNWDFGGWVLGVEGDWSHMRWKGTVQSVDSSESMSAEINNLVSIRARIGIPVGSDRSVLPYVTGGGAWVDASATAYSAARTSSFADPQTVDFDGFGGVVGGGVEWAATNQFRVRLETLYYIFDDSQALTNSAANPGDFVKLDNIWTVRAGATWYFNR